MVFKQKDSEEAHIRPLELRIKQSRDAKERANLQKTLNMQRAGVRGEKQAAYHIDFLLKRSTNWAAIHDLRIELHDRVAQIDHILINRFLEIFVIETKSYRTKIRYENDGWERLNSSNFWEGIESPVEQNENHILVLKDLIETHQLAPTRFGLRPNFINIVSVQGSCSIVGKLPAQTKVIRVDSLVRKLEKEEPSMLWVLKIVSPETLHAFAQTLVTYHRPIEPPKILEALHEGPASPVHPTQNSKLKTQNSCQTCQSCSGPITPAEINFCKARAARFAGKHLCRSCQQFAPPTKTLPEPIAAETLAPLHDVPASAAAPPSTQNSKLKTQNLAQTCQSCSGPLSPAEIRFCKDRAARFGGKLLCRPCQVRQAVPSKATLHIKIAPKAPQTKTHSQNPAPSPLKVPQAGDAKTQTWEERYNEIKIEHPRAYEEWTPSEEARLVELFKSRSPIRSIAQALDRQPGGIRARLIKLKLIEPSAVKTAARI